MKAKIFDVSCRDCHRWTQSYATVLPKINSSDRGIEAMIRSGRMPDTSEGAESLSDQQKEFIYKWLEDGAPEFADAPENCEDVNEPGATEPSPTPTPTPAPTPVPEPPPASGALVASYVSLNAQIFEPRCNKCHSPEGRASDYDFTSYAKMTALAEIFNPQNPENSVLIQAVRKQGRGQMPPASSGLAHLTEPEIAVLLDWIRAGLPEKL